MPASDAVHTHYSLTLSSIIPPILFCAFVAAGAGGRPCADDAGHDRLQDEAVRADPLPVAVRAQPLAQLLVCSFMRLLCYVCGKRKVKKNAKSEKYFSTSLFSI